MPVIKTPNGKFHFRTKPLYPGVKQIDKEISKENLFLLQDLFNDYGIEFLLSFGSLLGAVRDNGFITHDEDIDLVVKEEFRDKFLANLDDLKSHGFELVRYDRRCLFSLMRKGEYIDFYFYRPFDSKTWISGGCYMGGEFMKEAEEIDFLGRKFKTHSNYIGLLECEYGPDWRTPVVWNNYKMNRFSKILFNIKEHLKDLLPDSLFMRLAERNQQRVLDKTWSNLMEYRKRNKN